MLLSPAGAVGLTLPRGAPEGAAVLQRLCCDGSSSVEGRGSL